MDRFLDHFFFAFHLVLIVFNLFGWIWRRTRRAHLAVLGLTLLSWTVLGFWYGLGYCPCTDWHWQVKRRLGETDLPGSYVKYYADAFTGMDWSPGVVDFWVGGLALAAFVASIYVNWIHGRKRPRGGS